MKNSLGVDLDALNKEQLIKLLAEYKNEADKYHNYEQAIKLTLNSIYGATGSEYAFFFNRDIAETITLQGQDAILYTEEIMNKYFIEFWHKDLEAHKKMGLSVHGRVAKPCVVYIDTDSCYISFDEAMNTSDWNGTIFDFIMNLYNYRLKDYIEKALQLYAKKWNSDHTLNFELESIAKNVLFIAKKKYIQNIIWTDPDIHFEDLTNVKTKGFEIVQSSTPLFARTKLKELVKFIFSSDKLNISKFVKELKNIRKEFKMANIENITINLRINNYSKYIKDDYNEFTIEKGCPMHVRAAGYHNFLLNNNKKYKGKYQMLPNAEKVKMYYCNDKSCNVFAFKSGEYPIEFAPEFDYDAQFERVIIDPINRLLAAIGLQTLDRNLIYASSVF